MAKYLFAMVALEIGLTCGYVYQIAQCLRQLCWDSHEGIWR